LTVGLSWDKVIDKEVKSSDNAEIGRRVRKGKGL
jgi:hypothetical protein